MSEIYGEYFEELDKYITDFKCEPEFAIDDYWGDCGIIDVQNILSKFTTNDWEILKQTIANKPLYWQMKLAYCLNNSWSSLELDILLELINTEDDELLVITLDSLRDFVNELNSDKIEEKNIIKIKIEILLDKSDKVTKTILEDFLLKLK